MSNPGNVAALLLRQLTDGMTWCPESAAGSPGQGGPGSIAVPLPEPGNFNQALKHPRGLANQILILCTQLRSIVREQEANRCTEIETLQHLPAARLNRNIPQLPDPDGLHKPGKTLQGAWACFKSLPAAVPLTSGSMGPKNLESPCGRPANQKYLNRFV